MKIIAVIGAGTIGCGIAHIFAQSGFTVKMIDVSEKKLDNGMHTIFTNLDRMIAKGNCTEEDKFKTLNNIITYTDIEDGVVGADMVIETATENVELKLTIFKKLNELCSHNTILSTDLSAISIHQISTVVAHPERVIGLDFLFNTESIQPTFSSNIETYQFLMEWSNKLDKSAFEYYNFNTITKVN